MYIRIYRGAKLDAVLERSDIVRVGEFNRVKIR